MAIFLDQHHIKFVMINNIRIFNHQPQKSSTTDKIMMTEICKSQPIIKIDAQLDD